MEELLDILTTTIPHPPEPTFYIFLEKIILDFIINHHLPDGFYHHKI